MNKEIGLYIHIPFCERKCIYCDFASFVCENRQAYFDKLIKDIKQVNPATVKSIYLGGGTPSLVEVEYIEEIVTEIKKKFNIIEECEMTIECNPNSADFEKLKKYRELGFNRLSIGVQSLHDDMLRKIGRVHNSSQAIECVENAKKAGFFNISADLMLGLPDQKIEDLIQDAKRLVHLGITHISAYTLQVEEGTKLYEMVKDGLKLPPEDETAEMYNELAKYLEKFGFERYEISNFAKKGFESKHNINYWLRGEYVGFGLSAHSFMNGVRYFNSSLMSEYILGQGGQSEVLSKEDEVTEIIMLGLRCKFGFSLLELEKLGINLKKREKFKQLLDKKILILRDHQVTLNPDFYEVSNEVICELI